MCDAQSTSEQNHENEINRLKQRIAVLEAAHASSASAQAVDAARYRFLRDEAWRRKPDLHDGGRAALMIGNHGDRLDAAIDAVLKSQQSPVQASDAGRQG